MFSDSDDFKPLLKRLLMQTQSFKEWCLLEILLLRPCSPNLESFLCHVLAPLQ